MDKNIPSSQTGASPVTTAPVTLVVPSAFQAHDPSLKGVALTLAINTGAKHPEIVKAAEEFKLAVGLTGEKYYHLLHALRHAKLQKKEATALLLGLGFNKGRASELNKLSSCKEEVWKKYSQKSISFRAALALENGKPEGDKEQGNKDKPKKSKAKIHSLPKPLQTALAEVMMPWLDKDTTLPKATKSDKRTEYGFTLEKDGRTLYFSIFADMAD